MKKVRSRKFNERDLHYAEITRSYSTAAINFGLRLLRRMRTGLSVDKHRSRRTKFPMVPRSSLERTNEPFAERESSELKVKESYDRKKSCVDETVIRRITWPKNAIEYKRGTRLERATVRASVYSLFAERIIRVTFVTRELSTETVLLGRKGIAIVLVTCLRDVNHESPEKKNRRRVGRDTYDALSHASKIERENNNRRRGIRYSSRRYRVFHFYRDISFL